MLDMLKAGVNYILDLGAAAMLPIILTIFGVILGQKLSKSFRAGLTVGIGFTGLNLVIGLLSDSIGKSSQAMIERLGLQLDILDVGWPIGAAITFATPIAVILIPVIFIFNIILKVTIIYYIVVFSYIFNSLIIRNTLCNCECIIYYPKPHKIIMQ